MREPLTRFATAPVLCALFAVVGGLAAGTATTQGLRLNSYGITPAAPVADVASAGQTDRNATTWLDDCADCSERTLGYRWATSRAIRAAVQCPGDSWDFQRGCLDYVRDPAA